MADKTAFARSGMERRSCRARSWRQWPCRLPIPSGLLGFLKENFASAKALITAKQTSTSMLMKAIVADLETSEGRAAAEAPLKRAFPARRS